MKATAMTLAYDGKSITVRTPRPVDTALLLTHLERMAADHKRHEKIQALLDEAGLA